MSRPERLLAGRVGAWPKDSTQMYILPKKLGNHYCIDQIDADAVLDWDALDRYPKLHALAYEGHDRTLIDYLATRKGIKELGWDAPKGLTGVFDFRKTHLESLGIHPAKTLTVRLPRCVKALNLNRVKSTDRVRVEAPHLELLRLGMGSSRPPRLPEGVARVKSLSVVCADSVRIKALLGCGALESLRLMGDPAFALPDPQHLAKFSKLRTLELDGAYELDASRFPALPQLQKLEIHGATKETAAILRERFAKIDLDITGIKSLDWVRANVGNPFRGWADDHGPRIAAIARRAWQAASAKPLGAGASLAAVTRALKPFIAVFNRLEATGDIDTIMREEIYDAFCSLVPAHHQDAAEALFDSLRDF